MKKIIGLLLLLFYCKAYCTSQIIQPGAAQFDLYIPLLKDKRVAVFTNHSALIGNTLLIDELLKRHVNVVKIFAPEHGFNIDRDTKIDNSKDSKTNLPIISLYGKHFAPTAQDVSDVDILVFDIQDVGVRFYTYISSLQKFMEAAIKYNKPLIILDRPNPNGFYVDGPVLDVRYKSFTGMQPIPVVYGMTIGEYAKMLVGEQWLHVTPKEKARDLKLIVIPCLHYTHKSLYVPPVQPSPNLPNIQSIYLYPALGMLEGTAMSVGRGTPYPFQVFGNPKLHTSFSFVPIVHTGGESPRFEKKICYGWNLQNNPGQILKQINGKLQLRYLLDAYKAYPDKAHFFAGFSAVAGNDDLARQIKAGLPEREIRRSWQPQLAEFKRIRRKYLLYEDFAPYSPREGSEE